MTQLLERKQEEAQAAPVATSAPRRSWIGAALVVLAIVVVAAVGYAVYEAATNGDGGTAATGGDSNSVAIVNAEIARQLALRYPEPSSVEIVNEQIALARLDTGPSSVEIVNEQIALAKLDTGPSSVEMVQKEIIEELRQRSITEAWEREYVAQLVNR